MPTTEETHARLAEIPNLAVSRNIALARYTRFGIGGPADLYAETCSAEAFIAASVAARASGTPTVVSVRFYDGGAVRVFDNQECRFHYRESIFKQHKDWIIFSTQLLLEPAEAETLRKISGDILRVRNEKFPVTMKCAGSIFKNLLLKELPAAAAAEVPESAVREGKVPAAWFLEQVGAKGAGRGDIHVATYHANLIYNAGAGT